MAIVKETSGKKKLLLSKPFDKEDDLENILADQPKLMIEEEEPDVTLVKRQVAIEGVGIADLLLVDSNGLPMVVETKLAKNGESRRQVVGQVFDYVSALTLLTVDELDQKVSGSLETAMMTLSNDEDTSLEKCWQACGANLRAGKARVVVAIDEAPEDLVRILRFLNEHSDLDVRLVEIKQYVDQESKEVFFVPRLLVGGEFTGFGPNPPPGQKLKLLDFFKQLLEKSNKKISLFKKVSPAGYQSWLLAGAGKAGLAWQYAVRRTDAKVELFFQASEASLNTKRFNALFDKKEQIEKQFGEPLEWDYKENRKQQYIRSLSSLGGLSNEDKWNEIQDDLVSRMMKLEKALRVYIPTLS